MSGKAEPDGDARPVLGWSPAALTVGVEEEFLLLDPETGAVAPYAREVIGCCGLPDQVVAESMTYQVETRTSVCRTIQEVRRDVHEMRRRVSIAAGTQGLLCVPCAVPPFGAPRSGTVTPGARYRELVRRFPRAMSTSGTCACHVHVGVPTRQVGVEVLLGLRRWLPALISLTAGSPIWRGRDTGWASQRLRLVSRWPTALPAPPVATVAEYDACLRRAIAGGAALDARNVYYLARLSPRYPTVEVRVADVCPTIEQTVAYAAMVRALVATVLDEWLAGHRPAPIPQERLRRACLDAARTGLGGEHIDLVIGDRQSGRAQVDALVAVVRPRLRRFGDAAVTVPCVSGNLRQGGPAAAQRRRFAEAGSPRAFVASLAAQLAAAATGPHVPRQPTAASAQVSAK